MSEALQQVVDAVWAPSITGVTVSTARRPSAEPASESYLVLPHTRRPRLLLPVEPAVARRAVGAYRGLRTARAEIWSRAIRASVLTTPAVSGRLGRLDVHAPVDAPRLLPMLAQALEADRVYAMLAVRRPEPVSKPTVAVLDPAGRPLGYAKVGRSALTDAMVRNEAATLTALGGRLPMIEVPRVTGTLQWLGHPVALLEPLPSGARRCSLPPFSMAPVLWAVAASGRIEERPLEGASYHRRLQERIDRCGSVDADLARLLDRWRRHAVQDTTNLRFGRSHGDWVSWNLGRFRGRFVVWDWERSQPDAPVGFDACHWYFQRARETHDVDSAVEAVLTIAPRLPEVGALAGTGRQVAEAYLLEAFVTEAESGSSAGTLRPLIEGAIRRLDVR